MKKLLRCTVILVIMIAGIMGMNIVAFADDDDDYVQELYNWSDVESFLSEGGKAILMESITNEDHGESFSQSGDAVIDMNGNDLFYEGDICEVNGTLVLINTSEKDAKLDLINDRGYNGVYPEINGTLACKGVNMRFSDIELNGNIIKYNSEYDVSYREDFCGSMFSFENTHGAITDSQFTEIARTMELPILKRKGYDFGSWTIGDKEVTSLKELKGKKTVKAHWLSSLVVTFDADGGTCDIETAKPNDEQRLTSLPSEEKDGMCFDGWVTADGKKVTKDTVFEEDTTVKAKWVTEASRGEDLAEYLKDQGFSQKKIDRIIKSLDGEAGAVASIFSSLNKWIIIGIAALIVLIILFLIIRNRRSRKRHRQFKMY